MVWWLLPSMNELSNLAKTRSKLKNRGMAVWDDEMKPWWQRGNNTLLCAVPKLLSSIVKELCPRKHQRARLKTELPDITINQHLITFIFLRKCHISLK